MALPRLMSSQGFIKDQLKALGYNPNPLGMCNGITGAYIQDDVLGDRAGFNKKIELMRDRTNLVDDLKNKPLTDELEEISACLKMINSYQEPQLHAHSNGLPLHPHDIESLSKIAGSNEVKAKGGLARVYLDENMYTPVEWCGYFQKLRDVYQQIHRELKDTPFNVSMHITLEFDDLCHTFGLSYDPKKDTWIFADPNDLPSFPIRSAEKSVENLLKANSEAWNLQPERAYQNIHIVNLLLFRYEKFITTRFISGSIQILTVHNHPELSQIKAAFEKFKSAKSSYCAPLCDIVERRTKKNRGLVHLVAKADDIEKMKDIIEAKGDINLSGNGTSALYQASAYGSIKILKHLCKPELKIDLNQLTEEGFTAAFIAVQNNRSDVLEILGIAGANLGKACKKGYTPLHKAAQDGKLSALTVLTKPEYKINFNCTNDSGDTPAFCSAKNNHADALMLLAIAGADLMKSNEDGWSPIHIAAQKGSIDALKVLLKSEFKINLDHKTKDDFSAIYIAATHNQVDIIEALAHSGANIHKVNHNGWLSLHIAAQKGHLKVLDCLLQLDPKTDLNIAISSGETAAFIAAQYNHFEFIKLLAEKGADINLFRKNGINTLHMAAVNGNMESVKVLQEYKCDILQESAEGHTAFYYAVTKNHFEVAEQLLKELELKKLNKEDMELLIEHSNKFPLLRDKISSHAAVLNSGLFVPKPPHPASNFTSTACLVM